MRNLYCVSLIVIGAAPLSAQQSNVPVNAFESQVRAAAALPHVRPAKASVRGSREHSNAPAIGAVIGAVALPVIGLNALHDSDSGPVSLFGFLSVALVGAGLGALVGFLVSQM